MCVKCKVFDYWVVIFVYLSVILIMVNYGYLYFVFFEMIGIVRLELYYFVFIGFVILKVVLFKS